MPFFADTALSIRLLCISAPFVLINITNIPGRIIYSVISVRIMKMLIEMILYFVTSLIKDLRVEEGLEDDG